MQTLKFVAEIKPRHIDLLITLKDKCPECPSVLDLIFDRDRGKTGFWEVNREALVLTQIAVVNTDRSLLVYATVGRGILSKMPEIVEDLKLIASEHGCSEVSARPARRGWSRSGAERLGFFPRDDLMVLELR